MADKLSFSLLQLIQETPTLERYKEVERSIFDDLEAEFFVCIDETFYEVKVTKETDYIFFGFDYGNPMPKDDNLTKILTGEKLPNTRGEDEVELTNQLFALYDFSNKIFYISNILKMKFIEEILSNKVNKKLILKKYFKTKDEFIETLKTVKEISFTDVNNLFNDETQRKALVDLTGIDAPETFTIKATYSKTKQVLTFLKKILSGDNIKPSSLVIKGCDESNFDFVYNADSFIKKIYIPLTYTKNGKYVNDDIFSELKKKIQNERPR